jgi:hypothetical protein
MEIPVIPAGIVPGDAPGALPLDDPADLPQPLLVVVAGGGDTTETRATLHAVPHPE